MSCLIAAVISCQAKVVFIVVRLILVKEGLPRARVGHKYDVTGGALFAALHGSHTPALEFFRTDRPSDPVFSGLYHFYTFERIEIYTLLQYGTNKIKCLFPKIKKII